ncbi:MAG: VTT domain-containing protein [Dehalococcoidales bacterium]|nr:VTT domain-containing protein [Dehalococcoidales bacterium]
MPPQQAKEQESPGPEVTVPEVKAAASRPARWAYALGIIGVILMLLMVVVLIIFDEEVESLRRYGYIGAFFISILGGATIVIPVPMLAVVFALGAVMPMPWLVGLCAALGELVGALTIYMTGHGAGQAISTAKSGRVQKIYDRLLEMMKKRGALTLFIVTSIINPFFYPAAFASGALRFGIKKYTVIVLIGKIIKCMTVVYAGHFGLKGIFRAFGIQI